MSKHLLSTVESCDNELNRLYREAAAVDDGLQVKSLEFRLKCVRTAYDNLTEREAQREVAEVVDLVAELHDQIQVLHNARPYDTGSPLSTGECETDSRPDQPGN